MRDKRRIIWFRGCNMAKAREDYNPSAVRLVEVARDRGRSAGITRTAAGVTMLLDARADMIVCMVEQPDSDTGSQEAYFRDRAENIGYEFIDIG